MLFQNVFIIEELPKNGIVKSTSFIAHVGTK